MSANRSTEETVTYFKWVSHLVDTISSKRLVRETIASTRLDVLDKNFFLI